MIRDADMVYFAVETDPAVRAPEMGPSSSCVRLNCGLPMRASFRPPPLPPPSRISHTAMFGNLARSAPNNAR
jgi:hypothetical protein